MDDLERLVAESDIRQLLGLYPQHADDGEHDAFAGLFSDDGVIRIGDRVIAGQSEIRDWIASTAAAGPLRHLMMNSYVYVTSTAEAYGSIDMVLLGKPHGHWEIRATPRYSDRFVKTAAGWRFAERALQLR
ncbi:nuclear transport factor 2 family protein [Streptomyces gardneri]|nr:nuclear transport factor 2 family protein [Streptomyces gardneri]